ncbi:MAG: tyrosine-type recombinase/integrase [Planctomycetes bacterium]|nr:tyrosine-type recombinase/integrase [Planctomycetota bacterium]
MDHALPAIPATRVRDLRVVDVLKFRAVRVGAGVSNRTANCDVAALRAMLNWGVASQLIAENPLASIKRLPDGEAHQVRRRRAMSEDEVDRFLAAVRADDERNDELHADRGGRRSSEKGTPPGNALRSLFATRARIPQAPLFEFLVSFGARYGEARTLAWGDVDLVARTASLRAENTKTRRARCVPLSRAFVARLVDLRELQKRALRRGVGGADRVFLSPEGRPLRRDTVNTMRVFDRALEAAGIARVDPLGRTLDIHALRHTAATRFARNGTPLPVTQRILGHSDPKMTARVYTHLDVEDLREAVEQSVERRVERA